MSEIGLLMNEFSQWKIYYLVIFNYSSFSEGSQLLNFFYHIIGQLLMRKAVHERERAIQ